MPESSVDTSELNVLDVETDPVLQEQKLSSDTYDQKSPEEILARRREMINKVIAKRAMESQMVRFVVGSEDTMGSGAYSKLTEDFWDVHDVGNRN